MRPKVVRRRKKKPLIPQVVPKKETKRKLFPVTQESGRVALHDEATGEFVSYQDTNYVKYQPYDPLKAETMVQYMSKGCTLTESMELSGLSYVSYLKWLKTSEDFKALINTARANRSMMMHEDFYANDLQTVRKMTKNYDKMTTKDVIVAKSKMALMKDKQTMLQKFQEVDAPMRFGKKAVVTTESHSDLAIKVGINIPDEVKQLIDKSFRPKLTPEGEFEIEGVKRHELVGETEQKAK